MAHELLQYWEEQYDPELTTSDNDDEVTHTFEHDLESFVWVFAYSVLRKVMTLAINENDKSSKSFITAHKEVFGEGTCEKIANSRSNLHPLTWINKDRHRINFLAKVTTKPLMNLLFNKLYMKLQAPPREETLHKLTYADWISLLEEGIIDWKALGVLTD